MLKPSVEVKIKDGVPVAEFWDCARLDPAPVRDLKAWLEKHLAQKGRPDLVVNLLGVSFAGSTALAGFVGIHQLCAARGGRIIFCDVEEMVREVFRLGAMNGMFLFARDVSEALRLLENRDDRPERPAPEPARPPSSPSKHKPLRLKRSKP